MKVTLTTKNVAVTKFFAKVFPECIKVDLVTGI